MVLVMTFDWDEANRSHIARHGVTPADCEEAIAAVIEIVPGIDSEEARWKTTGIAKGRRLEVVWTIRRNQYRVVTAYWKGSKRK